MLNTTQREAIVREAMEWVGTPYRGWCHLKGIGADCGQFIYGVYRALELLPEVELPKDYSLHLAQHRESTEYVDFVSRFFREITEAEVLPGDVVLYKIGHAYAHAALIVEWPGLVLQAEARHGVSGANGKKFPFLRRADRRYFTLKEVQA